METVIAAAIVAGIALIGSLYVTFKTRSGRVGTTEAEVLWAQQQKHISVITARLDHFEKAYDIEKKQSEIQQEQRQEQDRRIEELERSQRKNVEIIEALKASELEWISLVRKLEKQIEELSREINGNSKGGG